MMNGAIFQRNLNHLTTGFFHRFLDSHRDFAGFTLAHSNPPITITHYSQGSKPHNTTTFYHFCNAVDCDHLFF